MPRPTSPGLTDHELSIMQVLWNDVPVSVQNILDRLSREPKPAYTFLLTAVQAMENKGFIKHRKDGKAYQYRPVLKKSDYGKSVLKRLIRAQSIFQKKTTFLFIWMKRN